MKPLIIKAKYGDDFIYNKLPHLLLKLINSELNKPINRIILTAINDMYKINVLQFTLLLRNNLKVSFYGSNVIIRFNNTKIKEITDKNGKIITINVETLVDFINYGNLQHKGSNSINKIISYLQNNIDTLYKLYRRKGSSIIWQ